MRSVIMKSIFISGLMTVLIISPFIPGKYDHIAVMISASIQASLFVSLLFIPVGMAWFLYEWSSNRNGALKYRMVMMVVFIVSTLCAMVACFVAIGGIGHFRGSLIFTVAIVLSYLYVMMNKVIPYLNGKKNMSKPRRRFLALYFVLIPLMAISARFALLEHAAEYSRNYVIRQSAAIIHDLEEYYHDYGVYPTSMQGVWEDYSPGIFGVEKFFYEQSGDSYNLFFEHFSADLAAREIVMYNKSDEHVIRSHPSFIFSLSPEEYERYRGYFAEHDLPQHGWKYYLFD